MKKNLFRHFKFSLFRGLFLSMLGVLLLTCGIMSIVMLNHTMNRMKLEEYKLLKSKLYTVMTDLENQIGFMKELTAEITYRHAFKWDYIQSSKYCEMEAISQLQDYTRLNDIWERCFVKYPDYNNILMSDPDQYVMPIEMYTTGLFEENAEVANALIENLYNSEEQSCVVYSDGRVTLFLIPTKRFYEMNQKRMVVGFEISSRSMQERINELVGELNGEITIAYKGSVIYEEESVDFQVKETLEFVSFNEEFKVYYKMDDHSYFSWENVFSYGEIFVFIVGGLIMLGLIFILSVWNYNPIRKIAAKYRHVTDDEWIEPDLDSIDHLIDNLLKSKEKDSKVLQEQYKVLQEQIVYMIISGYNVEMLKNHMTLLSIDYTDAIFGVFECIFRDDADLENIGNLILAIQDLSGDGLHLYPCYNKNIGLKILCVVEEENQFDTAIELLSSLFEALQAKITLKPCDKSYNLEKWIPMEAIEEYQESKVPKKMNKTARQVVEYVQEHFAEYDLSLDNVASKFELNPTYMSRIIKQELGMGYKDFLMELRMNKAKEMLLEPSVNVSDVCMQVGYANPSHFIKLFSKYTGMTPAKYREEYLSDY